MNKQHNPSQRERQRFPPRRQRGPLSENEIPQRQDPKREVNPRDDSRPTERKR